MRCAADKVRMVSRRRAVMSWLLVIAVAGVGAVATFAIDRQSREAARGADARRMNDVSRQVRQTYDGTTLALEDLRELFLSSTEVTPAEFAGFTAHLLHRPNVQAVAFLERVAAGTAADWMHRHGVPIIPAPAPGAEAFPLVLSASGTGLAATRGRDLSAREQRGEAMRDARDTASPRISPPEAVPNASTKVLSVFAPMYRGHTPPSTVGERRRTLRGFVAVFLRADLFGQAIADQLPPGAPFEVRDGASTVFRQGVVPADALERLVPIAGRLWTVRVAREGVPVPPRTAAALLISILVTVAVALSVLSTRRRERYAAAQVAARMRERDDAESALMDSEMHHRLVLDSTADAIVTIDDRGTILSANYAVLPLLGWEPDELVGQPVTLLMPDAVGEEHAGHVARRASGAVTGPLRHTRQLTARRRDGSTFPVLVALGQGEIGGRTIYTGVMHDITTRVQAERAAERFGQEQAGLYRIATSVAAERGERVILAQTAEESARLLGADCAAVFGMRPNGRARVLGVWGTDPAVLPPLEMEFTVTPQTGAIGRVVFGDGPARVPRAATPGDEFARRFINDYAVTVAAPIVVDGVLWGVVCAAATHEASMADDAEERLERFALLVALAVTSADARRQLAAVASTDHLTGLWNQRAFHGRLTEEVARARRNDADLSLVLMDIDFFKAVNDTFGHETGDRVLAEFALRLRGLVRGGESLARVGGEEFAWILPDTDSMHAYMAVERARRAIAAQPFPEVGRITVSAGVCDMREAHDTSELFRLADMALYRAKNSGRDMSCRYTRETADEAPDEQATRRLQQARAVSVIQALARTIDARDPSTLRHSERVADLATCIAQHRGWSEERIGLLRDAALVHDVGKIGIPDAILFKPASLDRDEYEQIKGHAEMGARMVADVLTAEQTEWIRHHHERVDGNGYPDGVTGENMSEGARILAVADAWDAMTAARPYGVPVSPAEALEEIERLAGRQFCATIAEAMRVLYEAREPTLEPAHLD